MEEMKNQAPSMSPVESEEEFELNHTDKLAGVFTEPVKTFSLISKFPTKHSDWAIPLIIYLVIMIVAFILQMNNDTIKQDYINKLKPKIEETIQKQVDAGQISKENVDSVVETGIKWAIIMTCISKPIGFLIMFFLFAGIILLISKYVLRGEGNYNGVLVSMGLPFYISVLSLIITVILSYVFSRFLNSTSLSEILNLDPKSTVGKLLTVVDVFQFWYLAIMSIGLAKMSHFNPTTNNC